MQSLGEERSRSPPSSESKKKRREITMAKVCQCCGRGPVTGNAVSHSNRHTRRRWLVNLQSVRIDAGDGSTFKVRVCTKCLKSGFVKRAASAV